MDPNNFNLDEAWDALWLECYVRPKLDKLDKLTAFKLFMLAGNSNPKYAIKCLQRAINCYNFNNVTEDGRIGPNTLNLYDKVYESKTSFVDVLDATILNHYISIAHDSLTQDDFFDGWYNRMNKIGVMAKANTKLFEQDKYKNLGDESTQISYA